MPFHRLVVPTYFGGVPGTHDQINDPATNGDPGVPSQAGSGKLAIVGHPNEGTYFVGFGVDGVSEEANRPHAALSENTDFIDDFLHENLAVPSSLNRTGIVSTSVVIDTTVDLGGVPIFLGPPGTPNTTAGLEPYFRITDQNNDDLVVTGTNTRVVVDSVNTGIGTFFSGIVTLTLNTIPPVTSIRVHFGLRSSLADMGPETLMLAGITSRMEAQYSFIQFKNNLAKVSPAGALLVGVATGGFTTQALSAINGGGLGTGFAEVQSALARVDTQLVRRRAFTSVVTDGTNSTGGDINQVNVDELINGTFGGVFMLRRGVYQIGDSVTQWTDTVRIIGESTGIFTVNPSLSLLATRAAHLTIRGNIELDNINLITAATLYKFLFTPSVNPGSFIMRRGSVEAGALKIDGSTLENYFEFEDIRLISNVGFTGSNDGWEHTGEGRAVYRRCIFDQLAGTGNSIFNLHDIVDPEVSSLVFESCNFESGLGSISALKIQSTTVPITFRNCLFRCSVNSGSPVYLVTILSSYGIVFDNCIFEAANGLAVDNLGSGVTYRDCVIRDLGGVSAGQNPQLFMGSGYDSSGTTYPMAIQNCTVEYDSVVRNTGSDVPTLAWLELGGRGGAGNTGRTTVDGLLIRPVAGSAPGAHKFTSVLLHGNDVPKENVFRNVEYDVGNQVPDVTGAGLAGVFDPLAPAYVEVATASGAIQGCIVENLTIYNIRGATVAHIRRILVFKNCIASNVHIDGSGVGTGEYIRTLVELLNSSVEGMWLFEENNVPCSGISHLALGARSSVRSGSMRFQDPIAEPSVAWIYLEGKLAELRDFLFYMTGSAFPLTTARVVEIEGDHCSIIDSTILMAGDPSNSIVPIGGVVGAAELRFQGNMVRWDRNGADNIISILGARAHVTDNQLLSTAATAPTKTVSGTDAIDANNMLAANATGVFV